MTRRPEGKREREKGKGSSLLRYIYILCIVYCWTHPFWRRKKIPQGWNSIRSRADWIPSAPFIFPRSNVTYDTHKRGWRGKGKPCRGIKREGFHWTDVLVYNPASTTCDNSKDYLAEQEELRGLFVYLSSLLPFFFVEGSHIIILSTEL